MDPLIYICIKKIKPKENDQINDRYRRENTTIPQFNMHKVGFG